jgi:hypothetical protein
VPELGEPGAAAEKIDEGGLCGVVGVVAEEDLAAAVRTTDLGEKLVSRLPRGRFEGEFLCLCQGADVGAGTLEVEVVGGGEPTGETGVGAGLSPAEAMVEVADDEFVEAGGLERVEQCDTIAAARDADQVSPVCREVLEVWLDDWEAVCSAAGLTGWWGGTATLPYLVLGLRGGRYRRLGDFIGAEVAL